MGVGGPPVGLPALGDRVRGPRGRLAAASAEGVARAAAEVAASAEAHPASVSHPEAATPGVEVVAPSAVTKASGGRAARNVGSQQGSAELRTRDAATKTSAGKGSVRRVGLLTPLALVVLVAILAAPVSRASAQPSSTGAPSDVSVTVGGRTVFTSGFTKWSTGAQSGGPNILSELTWRGVEAVVPEVNAEVVWKRLVLLGAFGGGFIRDGVLNDDDFLGNDRQGRFSHTRSSVGGDGLFYGSVDLGFRAFSWTATGGLPGYVDAFAGFQYWQENYDAFGATGTFGISPSTSVIREEFTWKSLRVGVRGQVPITPRLAARINAAAVPWTRAEVVDVHPLRTDVRHDPSFTGSADGGIGVQADGGLAFMLRPRLALEAGFRYWRIDSGTGTETARGVTVTTHERVNEIRIERYGPFVGVTYRF